MEWNGIVGCLLHWRASLFKLRSKRLYILGPIHSNSTPMKHSIYLLLIKERIIIEIKDKLLLALLWRKKVNGQGVLLESKEKVLMKAISPRQMGLRPITHPINTASQPFDWFHSINKLISFHNLHCLLLLIGWKTSMNQIKIL